MVPEARRAFQVEPEGGSWDNRMEILSAANEQYKGHKAAGHSPSGVPSAKARSKSPEGMLSINKKIPSRKRWDYLVMQKKSVCRIDRLTDGSGTQD